MKPDTIHYLTQGELKGRLSVIDNKRDQALFDLAFTDGWRNKAARRFFASPKIV